MVLLAFVIGVMNLCLGYALAVHLGYGPPTLRDAWRLLSALPRASKGANDGSSELDGPASEPEAPPDIVADASGPSPPAPGADVIEQAEPRVVDALRHFVGRALWGLSELTARLERSREAQTDGTAWRFVAELEEICRPYLQGITEVTDQIFNQGGDPDDTAALSGEVEQIVLEQIAQLETTLSNLQHADFASNVSAARSRLRTDTRNTLSIAHRLQKALQVAPEIAC